MDSSIAMTESSALSPNLKWSYDVFLSFRGEDTRSNFTSHLDMALRQKGVNVFIDDKLNRGELISESLFRSIEEALISIVIFSENYASSSWCLDELVKIIECKKSKGQIVWPIFYKVDPSDVRKQTGSFGEALATHQAKFETKIQIWREALTTTANLSGWDLGARKEADLIQDLVKEVWSILNLTCTPLYVAKYPVGIDSQLENLRSNSHYWTQDEPSNGIYMLGIYGIGGMGKTTLAKALYNKIANQFEACCFLSKVKEVSKQFNGLVQLQEHLLHEILKEDLKVGNLDKGINIIKNRLRSKKVLIVVDDVDKLEQLEALVGGHDWFGAGSMIIVTTRNNRLISTHEFDQKYGIQGMNHNHALELFSWYAFKKSYPPSNYLDLSKRATSYCKGHPLALRVLGSFLCTKDDQVDWRSVLDEYENSLSKDIFDILQISFDGLEEKVKKIFLDISCFLVGEKVDYVKNTLNSCHFNPNFGILVLENFSLITIENNEVQMHDLIRQMGHKIVNGESSDPGKRSRLWLVEDILRVFDNNSGTDAIEAIKLELHGPKIRDVDPQAFRKMKNLRWLFVRDIRFSKTLKYLPENLKLIKWHGFTQESLPSCFITKNLVGLDLQHSFIRNLGKRLKEGKMLKFVDLSYSTLLETIPDLSAVPNLEELYLKECTNLRMIHKSIRSLNELVILDLEKCSNFRKLPGYLSLKSLRYLNLSHCKKLREIPDFSMAINLESLYFEKCTNLRVIHESIGSLDSLVALNLKQCTKLEKLPSCLKLKSLKYLELSGCSKLKVFPKISENMKSLMSLYLDSTGIKELPSSIGNLIELKVLNLDDCTNLISVPSTIYLLQDLRELHLSGCSRFEMFPYKWELPIHPTCSSSNYGNLPTNRMFSHFTLLDLRNCKISNVDFLEILCDVTPFLNSLLLSENKFSSLPSCLHKFTSLWNLQLKNCKFLQQIPNLPQCIQTMDATGCESLARSPDNILDIISSKQEDITLGDFPREFILMNIEISKWFRHQTISNSIKNIRVVKCREVHVSIRSCGVHLIEVHRISQNDVKGPGVMYTDFDDIEELPSRDVIKSFAQEVSTISDCAAMLHARNFPAEVDSKIQVTNFPLHVTSYGVTWIGGMEGMAETTLAKSIFDKLMNRKDRDDSFERKALNNCGGLVEMNQHGCQGRRGYGSNFTGHLDMALRQKGVDVFIDDKFNRGELISESLFRSIEEALISIVIFSKNYAYFSWYLNELVKIIECKKSKSKIVCSIFYNVDPLDVGKQTRSFEEALPTHQDKFKMKIQIWKDVLTAAANLGGI
ncbi:Disease resistance protein RUN1, partial [Cucurbita argyrosperma subsp. sororia]